MNKPWKIMSLVILGLLVLNAAFLYWWTQRSEDSGAATTSSGSTDRKILFYRHPMQPSITSKVPAKDEMGMDYIPVYEGDEDNVNTSTVDGRASFPLSPENQQKIGITTTVVTRLPLTREIRATGRVAYDPELFAAIEEYRQALLARQQLKSSSYQGFVDQSAALVKSSETRLKLLGLTDAQIQQIARGGSQAMNLILPKGKVWIYAEVFEYEVTGLKAGQRIEAEAPSIPGEVFQGKISSISPVLNAPTRTIRVRAEVPDPKGLLRPDTYLNVRILTDIGERLAIPDNSILFSNNQAYVFVKDAGERFHPRAVQLGAKVRGFYEVKEGLESGEVVVTGANFLLDSESRLQAVIQDKQAAPAAEHEHEHEHPAPGNPATEHEHQQPSQAAPGHEHHTTSPTTQDHQHHSAPEPAHGDHP
jgi:Cu(I)/Ag(I) efflux system membrane fusion protein